MSKCNYCAEKVGLPFQCSHCKKYFCTKHLPPENHMRTHASVDEIISERSDKVTGSLPILLVRLVILTVLVVTSVMVVDAVALWLLNLVADVGVWIEVLFFESLILLLFGVEGAWQRIPHSRTPYWGKRTGAVLREGWKKPQTIKRGFFSSPDFWISLAIAGTILLLLMLYLFL